MKSKRRAHPVFTISKGALGPVPPSSLDVKPLTVFIGKQGTGKSLVAQVLYWFEALPSLAQQAYAELPRQRTRKGVPPVEVVAMLLDGLRAEGGAFSAFVPKRTRLSWGDDGSGGQHFDITARGGLGISESLGEVVAKATLATKPIQPAALYCPTERIIAPMLSSLVAAKLARLPLTYIQFDAWLNMAAVAVKEHPSNAGSKEVAKLGRRALGGVALRSDDEWVWRYDRAGGQTRIGMDMASSGQRANFSLVVLARALFRLREVGKLPADFALYVEEPEIHLHPAAQRDMAVMLAFLVNQGFRVVVTTHSLTMVYALNNCIQAQGVANGGASLPPLRARLEADDVAVYHFQAGERPVDVMDHGKRFIDESALGSVAGELQEQLNQIADAMVASG